MDNNIRKLNQKISKDEKEDMEFEKEQLEMEYAKILEKEMDAK